MRTSAAFRVQFQMTKHELQDTRKALEQLPTRIRGKVLRKGLREWAAGLKKAVRSAARRKDRRTRRDVAVKTVTYRRGKSIWVGVGVRTDGNRVGWKSHLHDGGYRPWQKGVRADGTAAKKPRLWNRNPNPRIAPFIAKNRGWRKGRTKRTLGPVLYKTEYITRPARSWAPRAGSYIRSAIAEAIREVARGGNTS